MPRFSIVIPCRERVHTLPFTLCTCLAQKFDDFEVVVADNQSAAAIRSIAESFGDARIRYLRTPSLLAMTDSWEFAVSQATGEFVTVVGNDDGLLLHALAEIDRLIRMLDARVLRWDSVSYNWPDLPAQGHAQKNALLIPLKQTDGYYPIHRRESARMIRDAISFRVAYSDLPMIQCSAIHRSLIDELRRKTGRVFQSRSPDIYSSFAFAHLAGEYWTVDAPMTINGLSGQSNGVACVYLNGKSPVADDFHALNAQARHGVHPQAPTLLSIPAGVADSFLHARDALFPHDTTLCLDRKQLCVQCIADARFASDAEWQSFRTELRRYLADDPGLLAWFDGAYGKLAYDELNAARTPRPRYGGRHLNLDASEFGVTNILEAAQLCEKLLGWQRDGVNAHVVPPAERPDAVALTPQPTGAPTSVASLQWIEIALSRLVCEFVPTRRMIDVGAHHGSSLEPFLRAGFEVIAFEPIEANRVRLASAFGDSDKLAIRSEAVSAETGTAELHLALNLDGTLHEYHHSLESINDDAWHRKGPTIQVPVVRLDDLVATGQVPARVGFLKIDTEGHDLAVLHGAANLDCDLICVEFWGNDHPLGRSPSPADDMIGLMRTRGFASFIAICHGGDTTTVRYSTLAGVRTDSWGNLFFFKDGDLFRQVLEHRDWLMVLQMSAECDQLRDDLRAKEAQIRELDAAAKLYAAAAAERLQLIEKQHHQLRAPIRSMVKRLLRRLMRRGGHNEAA